MNLPHRSKHIRELNEEITQYHDQIIELESWIIEKQANVATKQQLRELDVMHTIYQRLLDKRANIK